MFCFIDTTTENFLVVRELKLVYAISSSMFAFTNLFYNLFFVLLNFKILFGFFMSTCLHEVY